MKLLIKEYLRSLKERDELDAILPDLLSELGFNVYSRPAIGVRQYGVDFAAVGVDEDGERKVFLFSAKAGDLRRQDWDQGAQALRPSLNEILDHYVDSRIPARFSDLPIVICICFGGDIDQGVEAEVRGFLRKAETDRVSFQEWNGDHLAALILGGALGPELLSGEARTAFRKSIAMLDEADASYSYFCQLVLRVTSECGSRQKDKIRAARQINICLWVLFVWSRDSGNLDASYRASEFASLQLWGMGSTFISKKTVQARAMASALQNVINLHLQICREYAFEKILPWSQIRHGISSAVESATSLDVNLRLFDVLGRISVCGLWLNHLAAIGEAMGADSPDSLQDELTKLADGVAGLVFNNPALLTPIRDEQTIDINLGCIFMGSQGRWDFVAQWTSQIARAAEYSYRANAKYPCILDDYRDLLEHPRDASEEYRHEATAASVLYPTLAFWAAALGQSAVLASLSEFCSEDLAHCTMQIWFPGADSEQHLYANSDSHGLALTSLEITTDGGLLMETIQAECDRNSHFEDLSAVMFGQLPLVLVACRHYRLPVPPNVWSPFFAQPGRTEEVSEMREQIEPG